MFALGVEFLLGRAVINEWGSRDEDKPRPEWPPHPDRVFMALAAAFGESGEGVEERAALEWLEELGPPSMAVPGVTSERTPFTSYVPTNDIEVPKLRGKSPSAGQIDTGLSVFPERRHKAARQFPAVVPDSPTFHLIWPDAEVPAEVRPVLERVCGNVTYLGHSSSPVRMWVADGPVEVTLAPTDGPATHRLRTFGPGRLADLVKRFKLGVRPQPAQWHGYAEPAEPLPPVETTPDRFDPGLVVLRQVGGRRYSLESAGFIAEALRDTLMKRFGPAAPEWLAGHPPGSAEPSRKHRPAIVPLGFVGREHADGHLLGVGVALPAGFTPDESRVLFGLLAQRDDLADEDDGDNVIRLVFRTPGGGGRSGGIELELDERPAGRRAVALRPETWTRPARVWTTVTPVVLPRYSKKALSTEAIVARACGQSGLPAPESVRVGAAPFLAGAPHVRSFVRPAKPDRRPPRPLTHAVITFPDEVTGPVLIGAGRYLGFGLCRPHSEETGS